MPISTTASPRGARHAGRKPAAGSAAAAADAAAPDRTERIRMAAFALYERRGCAHGHELDDWLQAEVEIDSGASPAAH